MSTITKPVILDETGNRIVDMLSAINSTLAGVPDLKIVTWADGTDAEIADMIAAHYAGQINIYKYWTVGDERTVHLSAMPATGVGESHVEQDVTFVLMNAGGKELVTAINGHTECAFIVGQKNVLSDGTFAYDNSAEYGYINAENTNTGGWNASNRRTWCNSVYKNSLPSVFANIFKEHKNITADGDGSTTATSEDYFALPAEKEIHGSNTYGSSTAETSLIWWDYYKSSDNRKKYYGDDDEHNYIWRTRSPKDDSTLGTGHGFCDVSSNGNSSQSRADNSYGIAPFGVI